MELTETLSTIATPILILLLSWIGKRYLDRKLEHEKSSSNEKIKGLESQLNHYLEVHKQKIRNSEFIFTKQYEASQDLYSIKINVVPPYNNPDMLWEDVIEIMSTDLVETGNLIKSFLLKNYTLLNPIIIEKLESAVGQAEEASFYAGDGYAKSAADQVYQKIKDCSSLLKADVDGQRLVEFKDFTPENNATKKYNK